MSDYTQTTDFSAKDALTAGDPEKAITGADVDVEFAAISTAIGTKYDSSDLASVAQAQAGTSTTTLMSPDRVDDFEQYRRITKSKDTDTARNTTTTLADDPDLLAWGVDNNYSYAFHGLLLVSSASATPDFKFAFQVDNALAASHISGHVIDSAGTATVFANADITSAVTAAVPATGFIAIDIHGIFTTGASTTNLDFQWAQNTSDATDVTLLEGSYIELKRLQAT